MRSSTLVWTRGFTRAAAGALLMTACAAGAEASNDPLVIRGASLVVELGPMRVAVEEIYPEGTRLEHGGVDSLLDEKHPADLATNAETQLLFHSLRGPGLRAIMTVAEGHYRIVARKSSGIRELADLKGKRVGAPLTSSSGYFLNEMLESAGLTSADIELHDIRPFTGIAAALEAGEVDAISIWEPQSENAVQALGDDAIVFPGTGVYQEFFNLNTTAANLADPAKRARIVEFVKALIAATDEVNRDPHRAQELVAEAGGYTLEEVAASWPHHTFVVRFPDEMLDVLVDEEAWLAGIQGRAPRPREELAKLLDRSVFDEAVAASR